MSPSTSPDHTAIPFGQRISDGRMVTVAEVPRGASCGCVCAACKAPLVAAKGEQRVEHFRHASEACAHGRETAIHSTAKQILRDVRRMAVRPREVVAVGRSKAGESIGERVVLDSRTELQFESVELECSLQEGVIADAIGVSADEPHIVEVWVRHRVDEEKLQKLKRIDMPALEIDLSDIAFCGYEELVLLVTQCPDRANWLHFPGQAQAWAAAQAALWHRLDAIDAAVQGERDLPAGASQDAQAAARWKQLSDQRAATQRNRIRRRATGRAQEPLLPANSPVERYEGPTLLWGQTGDRERLRSAAFMQLPDEAIAELLHHVERRYKLGALEPEVVVATSSARWRVDQATVRKVLVDSGYVTALEVD